MGRYDFRAQRVYDAAAALYRTGRAKQLPIWHDVVHSIPPPEILTRTLQKSKPRRGRGKSAKMFQPVELKYPEDKLRQQFFGDHPWELARPRVIVENNGNDAKHWDWSRIEQPGKKMDGESVVQRQYWLMTNENLEKSAAYDKARKEFYYYRHMEDVERRVAQEEAISTGAYFGKGALEIGMELEDKQWENWREWATKQVAMKKNAKTATDLGVMTAIPGTGSDDAVDEEPVSLFPEEEPAAA